MSFLSIMDHRPIIQNFQKDQLNSRFPVFSEVIDTLKWWTPTLRKLTFIITKRSLSQCRLSPSRHSRSRPWDDLDLNEKSESSDFRKSDGRQVNRVFTRHIYSRSFVAVSTKFGILLCSLLYTVVQKVMLLCLLVHIFKKRSVSYYDFGTDWKANS